LSNDPIRFLFVAPAGALDLEMPDGKSDRDTHNGNRNQNQ
jgi:hypothetical protein